MLAAINSHPRDSSIIFDEKPHIYTVLTDQESKYTSVTTFIHQFFAQFDADLIISKMMKSVQWPQSKYFGQSSDQIKELWENNRVSAATAGTNMHKSIECFYNSTQTLEDFVDLPDMQHFISFYEEYGVNLKPYRSEWMIFDEELKLAGSIDFLTENDDGSLDIYDWKRSKEIKKVNPWQSGLYPINHIPDTNYWHYSIQLNLYKALLEKNYDKKVRDLYLVVLHPDNPKYILISVPDLSTEINSLFEYHRNSLLETSQLVNIKDNENIESEHSQTLNIKDNENVESEPTFGLTNGCLL
jgi:ATP-dependent exoDNAse (exonuclease V) beta subunit